MNIWYFHHYATPNSLPGLHRPYDFGEHFSKLGNDVTVFSSSYLHYAGENMIADKRKYLIKEYNGIKTIFVRTNSYSSSGIDRFINMVQYYSNLLSIVKVIAIKNELPDIIIASSPHPLTMVAGLQVARKYKVPCISEIRDFWPEVVFINGRVKEKSIIGRILLFGEKWIYKTSNALLFLKEGDYEYLIERGWDHESGGDIDLRKCFYVNNGVNLNSFDEKKSNNIILDKDLDDDCFKVIYCGSIRPVNHVELLVDAGEFLPENVKILIYGMGDCLKDLERRIEERGIQNVKLKGFIENKYIPYILSKSSVNILNYSANNYNWSRGNSSNKLFEYLASGKPVLSTIKMGYDLIERYSCGISISECTPQQIAQQYQNLKQLF